MKCELAPEGWYCTREKGHDGPCAAHPETVTPVSDTTDRQWHYQEKTDAYTHIVRTHDGKIVVQLPQDTSGKAESDARLISAAPDLLNVCRSLLALNEWSHGEACDYSHIYSQMDAAIQKAVGK